MARAPASMVIVSEYGGGEYCSGFVADTEANQGTIIITQPAFVKGRENRLKVCFFDGTELRASLYRTGQFCLLRTEFHPRCEKFKLMQGDVTISPAMIFPPSSPTTFYRIPSFVSAESLESYPYTISSTSRSRSVFIPAEYRFQPADGFFLVDCHYSEVTSDDHDRLFAAPVYDENDCVMGIVVQKCEGVKKLAMSLGALLHLLMKEKERDGDDGSSKAGNKRKRGGGEGTSKGHRGENKRNRGGGEGRSKDHSGGFGIGSKVSAENKRNRGGGEGGSKSKRGGHDISSKVEVSAARKGKMGGCVINSNAN